ncbi:MAG: hypothetical protein IT168_00625 [Bryobacterales bacterium]|nr:hypothetical protein [Bryobacterales bacterium]
MKNKGILIIVVFALAFLAIMWTSTRNLSAYRVEVCMEYQGRSACRTAAGATREQAERTARDNACALIASGMTDSIACQNTAPQSVSSK